MILLKEIDQNYRFLVSEITKQLRTVQKQMLELDPARLAAVESREDYIDILKNIIENKCFSRLITSGENTKNAINITRAVHTISVNLERIGDFCVNIMRQFQYFDDPGFMSTHYQVQPFLDDIFKALDVTNDALFKADLALALEICRAEFATDRLFKAHFGTIIAEIKEGHNRSQIQNLITALFIFRYLERIGDSLLNIGEAIISTILGEKLKIHQYEALEEGLDHAGKMGLKGQIGFSSMGETRSGCRIGLVRSRDSEIHGRGVIFKDGKRAKIRKEKEGIEQWESLIPGLLPKIFDYQEHGPAASILLECLSGLTFQDILINENPEKVRQTLTELCRICREIWHQTLKPGPVSAGFIQQLQNRLEDVFELHPEIQTEEQFIGDSRFPGLIDLLKPIAEREKQLPAPFSVFVHGDFNVDNIIWDQQEGRMHYIDLHRSSYKDYLQDVSVFLVSIFRLPAISSTQRPFINEVLLEFFHFCQDFARGHDDVFFEARLALGLARSFITSTRFQLNSEIAQEMFYRGMYLLRKFSKHDACAYHTFRIPHFVITF